MAYVHANGSATSSLLLSSTVQLAVPAPSVFVAVFLSAITIQYNKLNIPFSFKLHFE